MSQKALDDMDTIRDKILREIATKTTYTLNINGIERADLQLAISLSIQYYGKIPVLVELKNKLDSLDANNY